MRILVTGKGGHTGSWQIRGEQLGRAIGATVAPIASERDIAEHDLVVGVKRVPLEVALAARSARKPFVWDVVDAWPQPAGNAWQRDEARRWIRRELERLQPDAVVWPTQTMATDAGDKERPQLVLPHHARPGRGRNPIRDVVRRVGYEGREQYLGDWRGTLEAQCHDRGWSFVVNPAELADVDVVVAFRGREWDGYAPRHWKSNVKLANAQATGTPFIGAHESGYLETQTGGEYWASSPRTLAMAFEWLTSQENRSGAAQRLLRADVGIESIAQRYRAWLEAL